ncbi:Peroxisomal coenzyme A diphosphatase 1 [Escovopsis weberi]|uniref:Peroxisomal coenzyme A diphosphatase 1 n=1 Tax=Escovopsis weberi TaxID=150374 RepID=A0A0M8N473_ESCWE|nr:Peroxisomal coenzyme A diphosphatase 1 [Escovopsis weberi]
MSSLNPRALAAINRFRSYKPPPFALWDALPVRKRAAVLVLLFADRWGDLRVVVTMRAATLRNFSGHAALPGGKADSESETPYQIARREAFEEIGLPMDDSRIPRPFRIEQLCCLPPAMARTHVVVTPCVAFLHADAASASASDERSRSRSRPRPGGATGARDSDDDPPPLVEDSMIPRLDAREVAAVFSAPFYNFLKQEDLPARPGETHPPGRWYDGTWIGWEGVRWRTHNFYVPVNNQRVSKPRRRSSAAQRELADKVEAAAAAEEEEAEQKGELDGGRFRVWGMTGRVLLDAARIAFGEEPEMEHCEALGDGDVIKRVAARGVFDEVGEPKDAKI